MAETSEHPKDLRTVFLTRTAAEVYLLLDFLSGRADRSLYPTREEQLRSFAHGQATAPKADTVDRTDHTEIERDLADPTRLVKRTMRIGFSPEAATASFESDAAFLMRARDMLNSRAAPATGATIAFTALVAGHSRNDKSGESALPVPALRAYPQFSQPAHALSRNVQHTLKCLLAALLIALLVSGYTAWGKIMLDHVDAVRQDGTAIQNQINAVGDSTALLRPSQHGGNGPEAVPAPPPPANPTNAQAGGAPDRTAARANDPCDASARVTLDVCARKQEIAQRDAVISNLLAIWEFHLWSSSVPETAAPDAAPPPNAAGATAANAHRNSAAHMHIELLAVAVMTVLGNYVAPIVYGLLGAMAFVLRRHADRLASQVLSQHDLRDNHIRLALGIVIGGCIGLVYSGSSASQTTGLLGAVASLSTAAIAFIAGYGVEGAFKALDTAIAHVFSINGDAKAAPPPSS